MLKMSKVLIMMIIIVLFSVQCSSPLPTPFKSLPASPVNPSNVSPIATQSTNSACELWNVAHPKLGSTACVQGVVAKSHNNGNDFIMEFDDSGKSIYGIAHNYFYPGIEGNCVRMNGEVKQDSNGRFYLQVDLPGQVEPCSQ